MRWGLREESEGWRIICTQRRQLLKSPQDGRREHQGQKWQQCESKAVEKKIYVLSLPNIRHRSIQVAWSCQSNIYAAILSSQSLRTCTAQAVLDRSYTETQAEGLPCPWPSRREYSAEKDKKLGWRAWLSVLFALILSLPHHCGLLMDQVNFHDLWVSASFIG